MLTGHANRGDGGPQSHRFLPIIPIIETLLPPHLHAYQCRLTATHHAQITETFYVIARPSVTEVSNSQQSRREPCFRV
jgi:hypothetical protein